MRLVARNGIAFGLELGGYESPAFGDDEHDLVLTREALGAGAFSLERRLDALPIREWVA